MPEAISLPLLDRIQIASPCSARWEDMTGDERTRHCAQCNLSVHNLSAMMRSDAERVLAKLAEGRVCARFYRRTDGTILTQDCPVGLSIVRQRARRAILRVAALIGLVSASGIAAAATDQSPWGERFRLRALKPFATVCAWVAPGAPPVIISQPAVAGGIRYMPPPGPVSTSPAQPVAADKGDSQEPAHHD